VTETPPPNHQYPRTDANPGTTPVPAVVINEILPRPGSDWNGDGQINNGDEFIEVENLGRVLPLNELDFARLSE